MSVKMRVRIAELARERGMTRVKLAKKLDVTLMTLRRWNKGKVLPSLSNIEALQSVFGVKTVELFDFK